jgi:putative toxin-antitoxin system antitoxin component (TIGR02293 family)
MTAKRFASSVMCGSGAIFLFETYLTDGMLMTTCDARTHWETAMAERQHTTGKASSKGAKHAGLVAGPAKAGKIMKTQSAGKAGSETRMGRVMVSPGVGVKIMEIRPAREAGSKRVRAGDVLIVDSKSEQRDFVEYSDDDFEIIFDLLGGSQTLGSVIKSDLDAHELLHRGLPRAALSNLIDNLDVIEVSEASAALGMSLRTLQRHKNTPVVHLDVQQSGRTWKFAEILAKATRVLGSQDEAEQWLRRPAIGLEQKRPIELLTTPAGVKLVEEYLGRLEYDVYT